MPERSQLSQEIFEQPEALARLLDRGRDVVQTAAERIRSFDPAWVTIAARGTSDNAARYAQYLLGAHNHLSVALAVPSLVTLYDAAPAMDKALVLGISQSGQSPDIVSVVNAARIQGAATLAISNDGGSPLALAAESCLPLHAGEEKAVAATKTYTTQLLALAMLSAALDDDDSRWDQLEAVPALVEETLALNHSIESAVSRFTNARQLIVVGRGFNYSTAFEVALKVKETSYIVAEPYSVADLLHGPVAMVEPGFPVMLVAPSGAAYDDAAELMSLLEKRGAEVVVLSNENALLARASSTLRIPENIPEWISPIVAIVAGQMWALGLALAKGLDPDRPRGLSKVTLTL
jgi:glutamine---fructose-6-phosphate transaminase (isomerizing)